MSYLDDRLRRAAHDPTLHFHHLRHSCANRLLWGLTEPTEPALPLPPWLAPLRRELALSPRWRGELMGSAGDYRGSLYLIARLMGHGHPTTTLLSYLHLLDGLHGLAQRQRAPHLPATLLQELGNLTDSALRKVRQEPHPARQLEAALRHRWPTREIGSLPPESEPLHPTYEAVMQHIWVWQQAPESCPLPAEQRPLLRLPASFSVTVHAISRPQGEQSEAFLLGLCGRWALFAQESLATTQQRQAWQSLLAAGAGWLPEPVCQRRLHTLPEAKRWKGLIQTLLPQIRQAGAWSHVANRTKGAPTVAQQRRYWQEKLGVVLEPKEVDEPPWPEALPLPVQGAVVWQLREGCGITTPQRALVRWFGVVVGELFTAP